MKHVNHRIVKIAGCILSLMLLIGCSAGCVRPPAAQSPVAPSKQPASVPADNPGAVEALYQLKETLKIGAALSSKATPELEQGRTTLNNQVDSAINMVESGMYTEAVKALEDNFNNMPPEIVIATFEPRIADALRVAVDAINTASRTTVDTKYGKLAGAAGRGISYTWKGIPYASPPVGELRWRAPRDPSSWQGVRHSTDSYNMAAQILMSRTWVPQGQITGSEDCLYLNVWRPQNEDKNLPVYLWIHGGGNNFGAARLYDGAALSSLSNMVVVVIQYRIGPFGWYNHPALKDGVSPEEASGNFGTLDTIQALKWVKENISAFGGNPDNITIAGQSAGGHNVMNLVISPLAKGLFHKAIGQSGGLKTQPIDKGIEMANATIDRLLLADGKASDMAAAAKYRASMTNDEIARYLRGKDTVQIIKAQTNDRGSMEFHPAYEDGVVIPGSLQTVIESGNYNQVPVILGSNYDEMKNFLPLYGAIIPTTNGHHWSDLYRVLDGQMTLDEVMPLKFDKELYEACGYYGSRNFKARFVDSNARALKGQQDDVYCYLFKWGGSGSGPSPYDFIFGAAHAVEIPFFFGWPRDSFGYAFTEQNKAGREGLQKAMMTYLRQFTLTGNPNITGGDLHYWEKWSNEEGGPKCIVFDATFTEVKIGMMTEEVTAGGIKSQVDGLSEPTRGLVKLWLQ